MTASLIPPKVSGSGPSRVTPIIINDNAIDFLIKPGESGKLARVDWRPLSQAIRVDAKVETVPCGKPSITILNEGNGRFTVRGQIAVTNRPVVRIAEVDDPASFARAQFMEACKTPEFLSRRHP
jgi:D-alanyl-D-alanine carboxypeptidase/D-alanyl-D-alanine-endopeptidase (penicillin-binding protein 4)